MEEDSAGGAAERPPNRKMQMYALGKSHVRSGFHVDEEIKHVADDWPAPWSGRGSWTQKRLLSAVTATKMREIIRKLAYFGENCLLQSLQRWYISAQSNLQLPNTISVSSESVFAVQNLQVYLVSAAERGGTPPQRQGWRCRQSR